MRNCAGAMELPFCMGVSAATLLVCSGSSGVKASMS